MIYRDFNHWFSASEVHGFSSASREFARELWEDLRPTMEASLNDHKKAFLELSKEKAAQRSELTTALLDYVDVHKTDNQPTFWKWWLDQKTKANKQ